MTDEEKQEDKKEETAGEATASESETKGDGDSENVEIPEKFKALVEQIESMSVLDLSELVKVLEKKFGVSAQAVAAAAPAAAGAAGGDAGAAEEKSEFDVELTGAGDQKIQVIKAVKEALGLGLKEAKDLVDGVPAMLKQGMKKAEAEELKSKVEAAGGSVALK